MSTPTPPSTTGSTSLIPLDVLFDNPVFAGGVGLAGLGAAATFGRRWVLAGAGQIKRRLLVDVEVSKQDNSFPWILAWMTLPRPPGGFLASKLTRLHHYSMKTSSRSMLDRPRNASFLLQPGFGKHIIQHNGAYIMVDRQKSSTANMSTGEPHETITFTTLWAHRHVFEDMFREAHRLAAEAQEGKTVMHTAQGRDMDWRPFGDPRNKRPLDSVILDEGVKERIVADVKDFLGSQQWYVERGIPYRRGYLLYGPPGSGKSSFIQSLAGELDFGVSIVNLSEPGITDDRLAMLLTKVPPRSILLLEDADAAFVNRRQKGADGYGGATVTFSGLLNALDGVAAGEERVAFLTTNHIDRLDEALIRPGRVDLTCRIGEATRYQAGAMWDRFYSDIDTDGTGRQRWLRKLEELGLIADEAGVKTSRLQTSTAAIQGLFLFNKNNVEGAIEHAEGLIPRIYEPEEREGVTVPA